MFSGDMEPYGLIENTFLFPINYFLSNFERIIHFTLPINHPKTKA